MDIIDSINHPFPTLNYGQHQPWPETLFFCLYPDSDWALLPLKYRRH